MSRKTIYDLNAEVFKALAHPLRLQVIEILQEGESCFSEVLEQTGGLKSNLSQHMSIMVNNGILKVRKDSRCNYYSLSSVKVAKACSLLQDVLTEKVRQQTKILENI
jgi:DNA-binding transcriptional ArsR family regulator